MRSSKYFFGIIFLAGVLFFSVGLAQAVCVRSVNVNGAVGNCCDNNLNQQECDAVTYGTHTWADTCPQFVPSCGFPAATVPSAQVPLGSSHTQTVPAPANSLAPAHTPTTSTTPGVENSLAPSHKSTSANTAATGTTVTTTFVNPIRFSTVSEVVGALLSNLKGIIATVAILFIVIGGVMYILSGGNEKTITTAKNTITSALIGLAIALAAPTFLKEIQNILGGGSGANPDELVNNALTLNQIAMRTLNLLLSITGILAIIGLVIGGSYYFTAYGDEKRAETGKGIITSAIIGIVIVMAALIIVRQIASLLGVS
ncbi:MAG: hypothetical protein Q8L10_00160 [Candidatus Moranbacteria bacterium]|nr:hypothetical protein [Candidatus Moranbacteria bacterium]